MDMLSRETIHQLMTWNSSASFRAVFKCHDIPCMLLSMLVHSCLRDTDEGLSSQFEAQGALPILKDYQKSWLDLHSHMPAIFQPFAYAPLSSCADKRLKVVEQSLGRSIAT